MKNGARMRCFATIFFEARATLHILVHIKA